MEAKSLIKPTSNLFLQIKPGQFCVPKSNTNPDKFGYDPTQFTTASTQLYNKVLRLIKKNHFTNILTHAEISSGFVAAMIHGKTIRDNIFNQHVYNPANHTIV